MQTRENFMIQLRDQLAALKKLQALFAEEKTDVETRYQSKLVETCLALRPVIEGIKGKEEVLRACEIARGDCLRQAQAFSIDYRIMSTLARLDRMKTVHSKIGALLDALKKVSTGMGNGRG